MITKIVNKNEFLAKSFLNIRNFFNNPVNSMDLNITIAEEDRESECNLYKMENILTKVLKLSYKNQFVLIPIIHTCN